MSSASGAGVYPPLAPITERDHGGYVTVTTFITMFIMAVFVFARIVSRFRRIREIKLDDIYIMLAFVFAILQSVCIQLTVRHGLGRHMSDLSPSGFQRYEKFDLASQILLIAVLVFAKLSLVRLLESLQPLRPLVLACRCTEGVIIMWGVSALVALAVQCNIPSPRQATHGQCVNQGALYTANGVINIVTDAIIVILPVVIMASVQTTLEKRTVVVALFATRFIVIAVTIVQLVVLQRYLQSSDKSWANITPTIWNQAMMNLSVLLACLPSMRRLLLDLQPGKTGMTIPEFELASTAQYGNTRYGRNSVQYSGSRMRKGNDLRSDVSQETTGRNGGSNIPRSAVPPSFSKGATVNEASNWSLNGLRPDNFEHSTVVTGQQARRPGDTRSDGSDSSAQMIIRQTQEWSVHYSDDEADRADQDHKEQHVI